LADGASQRRIGLKGEDRLPVRSGAKLYADDISARAIGIVTSGGFGPTVQAPIAMGYVDKEFARSGNRIFGEVRAKRVALRVSDLPFVPYHYKRN
jgi:aminomethyltransferase